MNSIKDIKKKIPSDALDLFEKTLSPSLFNKLLLSFRVKRKTTFRINSLKGTVSNVTKELKELGYKFSDLFPVQNAFRLEKENSKLLRSTVVKEGKIYLQSFASLLPSLILSPKENEKILDIAAAPGSKTSQISAMMNNTGIIDAVEPDLIRLERLKHNIDLLGCININFYKNFGERFYKNREKTYDRVLADVPCSGEGRFSIHESSSYLKWKSKNISKFSVLQTKLLKSAILSTKINGIIVYSTCTLNIFENEKVINNTINDNDIKIEILPIEKRFKNIKESVDPILKWDNAKFDSSIGRSLRILPSERIEGFFVCKMKRIN